MGIFSWFKSKKVELPPTLMAECRKCDGWGYFFDPYTSPPRWDCIECKGTGDVPLTQVQVPDGHELKIV